MRRVEDGASLPRPAWCELVPASEPGDLPAGLDELTLSYVLAARPAFDQIRQTSGQLAGLLLLAAVGLGSAQDHPMFTLLLARRDAMRESLGVLRPPASAEHHHRHLRLAARAVSAAVDAAECNLHRRDDAMLDAISERLRGANQELQWAAAALPGFAVVDLRQACCASHATFPNNLIMQQ
jgi:hypothetical protein